MSRKQTFIVTLEFESKMTDDKQLIAVATNIARAIESEANNGVGIAPDDGDNYTKSVSVKPQFLDETVKVVICAV